VTCSTKLRSRVSRIHEFKRLMRLVTSRTILLGHGLGVRLMTINTVRNISMGIHVAEVTSEGLVLARASSHLLTRTRVTGDTNSLVLAFEVHIQRLMRVMAAEAILYFVVSAAVMTIITIRNVVFRAGTMTLMTSLAIDLSLVRRTVCCNFSRLLCMTLGTVINS
jgi:hypothetical protein